jgi:MscS family membrane protein
VELISAWVDTVSGAIGLQPWAMAVFLIVLASLLLDFIQRRVLNHLKVLVIKTDFMWDDALLDAARRPVSLIIWLLGVTLAAQMIPVKDAGHLFETELIVTVRQVAILSALAWFLVSFVKNIENGIIENARRKDRKIDQTTIIALGRIIRITIIVTVTLIALNTMGVNVSGLMAAGGIGGLAVGLASKDMLANFFGGFTVYLDRPFSVGDWIVLKDKGIEGVVEDIGWRQTTIRKFDKRPVYVPNAIFTTATVENPSRMSHRRIYETIGLRYDDLDQMDQITGAVRAMLSAHSEIDQTQTLMVNFNAFNTSSVDFFVYCMTHTVNWQHFHEVKQDVLLKINQIVVDYGAQIAYPTRTLKMEMPPQFAGIVSPDELRERSEKP